MIAEGLLFGLTVFIAFSVRSAILKWRRLDERFERIEKIEELTKLIKNKIDESTPKL